ncbi:hypothetical protein [Neptuniibacter marinus]|uniref:hypothetical protein n=1 Tax=Neptuniibacter marinus TaxID=1806670 RepID=UPI003B59128E
MATIYGGAMAVTEDIVIGEGPANTGMSIAAFGADRHVGSMFLDASSKLGNRLGGIAGTIVGFLPVVTGQ